VCVIDGGGVFVLETVGCIVVARTNRATASPACYVPPKSSKNKGCAYFEMWRVCIRRDGGFGDL